MCLIAFAWQADEAFPFVLSANRDEFYDRPTQAASFWSDHSDVLAGRDLQAGGTWLGVNRSGRIAALTNVRNPSSNNTNARSRGELVANFLIEDISIQAYCQQLLQQGHEYNAFNLLLADGDKLVYVSNVGNMVREIKPGIHTLSNASLDTEWPKTRQAYQLVDHNLNRHLSVQQWALLLNSRQTTEDELLPDTGVSKSLEKSLSSQFIVMEHYGTRSSTGLLVDNNGRLQFYEQSFVQAQPDSSIQETIEHFW